MIFKFKGLVFNISPKEFRRLQYSMSLVRSGLITRDQAVIDMLKLHQNPEYEAMLARTLKAEAERDAAVASVAGMVESIKYDRKHRHDWQARAEKAEAERDAACLAEHSATVECIAMAGQVAALLEVREEARTYQEFHRTKGGGDISTGRAWDQLRRAISRTQGLHAAAEAHDERVRAEEREACAKVADQYENAADHTWQIIAAAIRARGEVGQ
jgi:hypothetical protein